MIVLGEDPGTTRGGPGDIRAHERPAEKLMSPDRSAAREQSAFQHGLIPWGTLVDGGRELSGECVEELVDRCCGVGGEEPKRTHDAKPRLGRLLLPPTIV